jgi:hypothetical protein
VSLFEFPTREPSRTKDGLRPTLAILVISVLAACSSAPASSPAKAPDPYRAVMVKPAVLRAGQAVPLPKKKPILTLAGKISKTNANKALMLDAGSLDEMGVMKVRLYEPTVKKQMSFQGVWLADVLKVAGVDKSASSVHFTALDDFQADLTTAQIAQGGVFLATKSGDGAPIDIENGGPTRIVFMDGVKAGKNEDAWIWSLKTLDVK